MVWRAGWFWIHSACSLGTLIAAGALKAQIIPDATLPINSSVTSLGKTVTIGGGSVSGRNLFHSFLQFSVPTGSTAYFNNSGAIANIISRVTGSSISNIDGLIRSNGSANLFLINPHGIIFGPNASLNIGGSFLASTAASIKFADGSEFSASNPQPMSLLTVSVPSGLQFGSSLGLAKSNSSTPSIVNRSISISPENENSLVGLRVQSGKTLALVGGEVALEGGIVTANSGRIEIGSVKEPALVKLTPVDRGWQLGYEGIQNFGDIRLTRAAFVNTTGESGGDIQIRGQRLIVTEGSAISADTSGIFSGGLLNVNTVELVELVGESADGKFVSSLTAAVRKDAIGNGGNLNITTSSLIVRDGAQAIVATFGRGNAGSLTVRADSVELSGVTANGQLASGLFASADRGSLGNGGNLTIEAGRLIVRDGAQAAAATFSSGSAGNLTVRASTVELAGEQLPRQNNAYKPSGLKASADIGSTGTGGNLIVETDRLYIRDGAEVQVSTLGTGRAGSLTIRAADSVELTGRTFDGQFASAIRAVSGLEGVATNVTGDGGDVFITTNNAIVRDGADIRVSATGTGRAGNLNIDANSLLLDNRAALRAETNAGDRGNIVVRAQDTILRRESNITTNAKNTASGGNISIGTNNLVALENSDITANAQQSFGGRVIINTQGIFGTQFRNALTPASDITASSDLGAEFSGIVEINTPDVDPSRGLVTLSTNTVDVGKLIAQRCLIDSKGNEFIVTGRGGLPPNPSDALGGSRILEDLGRDSSDRVSGTGNNRPPIDRIVEARSWTIDRAGAIALTAPYEVPSASVKCL